MSNAAISERKNRAISRGVGMTTQIYAATAENAEIWDEEGRRYIDFASGIAVVNTGHRHPKVIEAVKAQLDRFTHTCHQVVPYENYVRLAERLNGSFRASETRRPSSSPPAPRQWKTLSRSPAMPPAAPQSSPLPAVSTGAPSWAWR